jgi:tetratricopeptide (TPR) repeat protein
LSSGPVFATVKDWDTELDVALLELDHMPAGVELVGLSDEVAAGDWYRATGFFELDPLTPASSVTGRVSDAYWQLATGVHALQLSCAEASAANPAVLRGLSGGPVCDGTSSLAVGLVRRNPDPDQSGVAMGGIVMATRIADVLRRWPQELAPAVHRPSAEAAARRRRLLLRQAGPAGAPPLVQAADPYRAGVKRTIHDNEPGGAPYVPRRIDGDLVAALGASACVIITGGSNVGKSRAAWQAASTSMPDAVFIAPQNRSAIVPLLVDDAARVGNRPALVWLDELREFLADGSGDGLDASVLDEVMSRWPRWRLLGTWRDADRDEVIQGSEFGWGARGLLHHGGVVQLYLPALSTPSELRHAELMYPAENFDRGVGIGEHLTAAPELLRDYERREQEDPFAWALVRAAADWRRLGMGKPMPLPDLFAVATAHARSKGIEAAPPLEEQEAARAWAFRQHPRSHVALLTLIAEDGREFVTVLDQVADFEESRRPGASRIPITAWQAAIRSVGRKDIYGLVGETIKRGDRQAKLLVADAGVRVFQEEMSRAGFFVGMVAGAYYELGKPEPALKTAEIALKIGPPDTRAHCLELLGTLHADRGDLGTAREFYEQAIAAGHEHTVDESLEALTALAERDSGPDACIAAYRRAAESGSAVRAWMRWRVLAYQCSRHGRNAEAAAANMKAAELAPSPAETAEAYLNAGGQFLMAGNGPSATTALELARRQEQSDSSAEAAIVLGQLHTGAGREREAIEEYRYARHTGTANAAGRAGLYLAALHERQGELDTAERTLRRVGMGEDSATAGAAWVQLARLATAHADLQHARRAIDRARPYIGVLPADAARAFGDLLAERGDNDAAIEAYGRATTTSKDQEYASTVSLAKVHAKRGDLHAAESVLRALAERSTPEIQGWCLYELAKLVNSPDEKLAVYEEAAATGFSDAGWARLGIAAVLIDEKGDSGRATEILVSLRDEAVPRTRAHALLELARIERRGGDTAAARADYAAVIEAGHYHCVTAAGRELGRLLDAEKDAVGAIAAYRAAVDAVPPATESHPSAEGLDTSALFTDPDAADAAISLAGLLKSDNAVEAEALYQRARASVFDRSGGIGSWGLAEIAEKRDDYPAAVFYFREACERLLRSDKLIANSAALAWQKLSKAHDDNPAEDEALQAAVAAAQPTFALWAAMSLVRKAVRVSDYARARSLLENAIETLPGNATAQAWLAVGELYALASDVDHARAAFQRAIHLGDRDTALAGGTGLGRLALASGDYPGAEAAFRAATEADDRDVAANGWSALGDMALAQNDTQAALRSWEKGLATVGEPGKHGTLLIDNDEITHRAHYALGVMMIDADPVDARAREHLHTVLEHTPCEHTAGAGLVLGEAEVLTSEPQLALASLTHATEAASDEIRAQAHYLRGRACGMVDDLDGAEIAYRKAAASGIQPWADAARNNLANTFAKRGKLAEARSLTESLLSSQDPEIIAYAQCTLGEVRGKQGALDDALHWLALAAESGIPDVRVQALLARGGLLSDSGDLVGARAAYGELLLEEDEAAVANARQALRDLDNESTGQLP